MNDLNYVNNMNDVNVGDVNMKDMNNVNMGCKTINDMKLNDMNNGIAVNFMNDALPRKDHPQ